MEETRERDKGMERRMKGDRDRGRYGEREVRRNEGEMRKGGRVRLRKGWTEGWRERVRERDRERERKGREG